MKKGMLVLIAVAVMVAFAVPAMAGESIFNEMSKSISSWKCPAKLEPCKATAATVDTTCKAVDKTTDALYNIVPTGTVK